MDALRIGLSREIRNPSTPDFETLEPHIKELGRMRSLGRLLAAEGEQARRGGDWGKLVGAVTNGVLLARGINHGDLLIDEMMGGAIEQVMLVPLKRSLSGISAPAAREAAHSLLVLDATRIPFDRVIHGEKQFARSAGPMHRLAGLFGRASIQKTWDRARTNRYRLARDTRLLAIQLAARAFSMERGSRPRNITNLVPDFIPSLPVDPATGRPLALTDLPVEPATHAAEPAASPEAGGASSATPVEGDNPPKLRATP
jgi:hypothetical protein